MTTASLPITINDEALRDFCTHNHILQLSLFGSVLRDDFTQESDVDVLVEFEKDAHIGWEIVTIADELSDLFGRKVDLLTPMALSRHFRNRVLAEAQIIYEREG